MTADDADRVAAWRYEEPWSIYDLDSPGCLLENSAAYFQRFLGCWLVGFLCIGAEARVPGLDGEQGSYRYRGLE